MNAIVLSGGGAKGAYEIGVWKALRKMHIKYNIVTGTSVGALNAALMCQKKFYKALKFWENLEFSDVIDEEVNDDKILKMYAKGILKGGITINNLESTVDKAISVKKIYKSKINIGIITFKVSSLKPMKLIKKGIPKNKFKDYLIASASCFPAFTKKTIDNEEYIDGGIYDNLPINLAIDMGADNVIAVDLKEIGLKQKVKNKNIPVKYISPRNDIGSFLIFDKYIARKAIRYGYNDTLKEYGKLYGNKYTFKKIDYKNMYGIEKNDYVDIIESLGYAFDIDDSYIYKIKDYNKILLKTFKTINEEEIIDSLLKKKVKIKKELIKYMYNNLFNPRINKYKKILKTEYLCATYLYNLNKKYNII